MAITLPALNFADANNELTLDMFREAYAAHYNYQVNIPDPDNIGQTIPNPETKAQFMAQRRKREAKNMLRWHRIKVANEAIVIVDVPE